MADKAASTIARLKNKARESGIQLQQLLNLFCQEEFLRRLSQSKYRDNLILKGGFLLYTISEFKTRPTMDADYLLKNYSNDASSVEQLVRDVINTESSNDFMAFEIKKLEVINEIKEYTGIRVYLIGSIERTKTPFTIDFGVGDIIVPSAVEREIPALLSDFERPQVLTYSLESTVAEKLDAIVSLMELTGRMKDFYDIYYLATTFDFDGRKLQEAMYETFTNRGRSIEKDSVTLIASLTEDKDIQKRWVNFCRKVLRFSLDFNLVVEVVINICQPPFDAIIEEGEFFKRWFFERGEYI